jgi:hypothetical protein
MSDFSRYHTTLGSLIQRNSVGLAVDLTSSVSFEFGQSNDSRTNINAKNGFIIIK